MQPVEQNAKLEGTMSMGKERIPEYWLDLIADTLKQLDVGVQGAFLQKFLQGLVGREIPEEESITHWEGILARQSQLVEKLGRSVTLRTAAVDYFGEFSILRNPVLLEYEELKKLRYNAATDPLTGLNNRRMFEEYLDQEIDRSARYGSSFALLAFDLSILRASTTYTDMPLETTSCAALPAPASRPFAGRTFRVGPAGTSSRSFFPRASGWAPRCWRSESRGNLKSTLVPSPPARWSGLTMELPSFRRMERTRSACSRRLTAASMHASMRHTTDHQIVRAHPR